MHRRLINLRYDLEHSLKNNYEDHRYNHISNVISHTKILIGYLGNIRTNLDDVIDDMSYEEEIPDCVYKFLVMKNSFPDITINQSFKDESDIERAVETHNQLVSKTEGYYRILLNLINKTLED